jgi:hypothetical protein
VRIQKAVLSSKADEVARNGAHLKTEFRSEVFWAPLAFLIAPPKSAKRKPKNALIIPVSHLKRMFVEQPRIFVSDSRREVSAKFTVF